MAITRKHWTNEEKEYLAEVTPGRSYKEITKIMNEKFDRFEETQIRAAIARYGLNTGRTGYFEKGFSPWNKGTKGQMNPNNSSYWQKGHVPYSLRPLGDERINVDGYIEIKVAEPNQWKAKHRIIYEEHHGKLSKSDVVIFADGNKQNLDINNLLLVSRRELLTLNTNKLITDNTELTKTGLNVAKVMIKMSEVKNNK